MGCSASVEFENDYSPNWMAEFEALQFTKPELVKLEKIFERIDDSADGHIDLIELLDYVDIKVCPFAKRVPIVLTYLTQNTDINLITTNVSRRSLFLMKMVLGQSIFVNLF